MIRAVRCSAPVALAAVIAFGGAAACGRGTAPSTSLPDGAKGADAAASVTAAAAADPKREELWTRARGRGDAGLDEGDLVRLADVEGESGLVARAEADPAWRLTIARAMAFAPEPGAFAGLPFLATSARDDDDALASAALESAVDLAARPRRAGDSEDAAEMKAGCDGFLALAKDVKAVRARRVIAIRALRMLADRGCVDPAAIPADLDAR